MLTALTLKNFALIHHHELSLATGFNVITGETGAGKSLLLEALALCLGGRADTSMIRHGADSADIYAQFEFHPPIRASRVTRVMSAHQADTAAVKDKSNANSHANTHTNPTDKKDDDHHGETSLPMAVLQWFNQRERQVDAEILIRRQLSSNGRSKAWLNGEPVSLAELKELGGLLVNIHSQHAQQALLKPLFVVDWLDSVSGLKLLAKQTTQAYKRYQTLKQQAQDIEVREAQRRDRIELLENQLADIAPLLSVDYAKIEAEHDELSNLDALMLEASLAVQLLDNDSDEPDAMQLLGRAIRLCANQTDVSATFAQAAESLYLAQQQVSEAATTLMAYTEQQLPDPERLQELDNLIRLGHQLSRKHGLPTDALIASAQEWQQALEDLLQQPTSEVLQAQTLAAWQDYIRLGEALAHARQALAPAIGHKLSEQLQPLALPNACCEFTFTRKDAAQFNGHGLDDIDLMFSANVGMPLQPLYKIASGGELSRMALVMQVLLATDANTDADANPALHSSDAHSPPMPSQPIQSQPVQSQPMLVFDEVDVGISGGTAQVVGELLRQLGEHRQVLAITHQAQVAAQAHQHILVYKSQDTQAAQTTSELRVLTGESQVDELARMSGGINITDITREHARSLLADVAKT